MAKEYGIKSSKLSADDIQLIESDLLSEYLSSIPTQNYAETKGNINSDQHKKSEASIKPVRNIQIWFKTEELRKKFQEGMKKDPDAKQYTVHIQNAGDRVETV